MIAEPRKTSGQRVQAAVRPQMGDVHQPWRSYLLVLVTLGIYSFVHHYRINRELRDFGIDVNPVWSLVAVSLGLLLVVPYLVSVYRTSDRVATAQQTLDLEATAVGVISVVAAVFFFLHVPYHQAQVNRVWQAGEAQ